MSVSRCPLCSLILPLGPEVQLPGRVCAHWYGCGSCGRNLCESCGARHQKRCDRCDGRLYYDRRFAARPREVADWRQLLQSRDGPNAELPTLDLIASVPPDQLEALDRALPNGWRHAFWDEVEQLEVRRRLGALDFELGAEREEVRFPPRWFAQLKTAWSYHARHQGASLGSRTELRVLLHGLSLMGPAGQVALDRVLEALHHRHPEVQREALRALRALRPERDQIKASLVRMLSSPQPEVRLVGLRALDAVGRQRAAHWPEDPPSDELQPLFTRALQAAQDRLTRASLEELDALVDALYEEPELDSLRATVRFFDLGLALLGEVRDAVSNVPGRPTFALTSWVRALGPAGPALAPTIVERFGARKSARLLEEMGPDAAPVLPQLEAQLRASTPRVALRLSRSIYAITSDLDRAAPEALRARVQATLRRNAWPPQDSFTGPIELARLVCSLLALPKPLFEHLAAQDRRALLSLLEPHPRAMSMLLLRTDVARELLLDPSLRPLLLQHPDRELLIPALGAQCQEAQLWLQQRYARTDEPWRRREIIEALGTLLSAWDHPGALPLVERFCDCREDVTLRAAAARALHSVGLHPAHHDAVEACKTDEAPLIRAWATLLIEPEDPSAGLSCLTARLRPPSRLRSGGS